jgi:hypothetical protein
VVRSLSCSYGLSFYFETSCIYEYCSEFNSTDARLECKAIDLTQAEISMVGDARRQSPLTLFARDVASPSCMTDARKQAREQAQKEAARQNTRSTRSNPSNLPAKQTKGAVSLTPTSRPKPRPRGTAAKTTPNPLLEVNQGSPKDLEQSETEPTDDNKATDSSKDVVVRENTPLLAWHGEDARADQAGIVMGPRDDHEGEDEDENRIREEDEMEQDHGVSGK